MSNPAVRNATPEIGTESVSDILKSINIPPCPAVVSSLLAEARRPEVDFHKITRLIGADLGLAAALIKTANSPCFGLRTKASSVSQAASLLGLKNIINIVNGHALRLAFGGGDGALEQFWEHSNQHALVAAQLARHVPGVNREDAYTFGLFHDCGVPVLMQRFADYRETLALSSRSAVPVCDLEYQRHGTDHVLVGALLARSWQLPALVVQAIRCHHQVDVLADLDSGTPTEVRALTAISLLAHHLIARCLGQPEEVEWMAHGAGVVNYLGFDEDELEDLRHEVDGVLAENREA